jgi:hypothetical protein
MILYHSEKEGKKPHDGLNEDLSLLLLVMKSETKGQIFGIPT